MVINLNKNSSDFSLNYGFSLVTQILLTYTKINIERATVSQHEYLYHTHWNIQLRASYWLH